MEEAVPNRLPQLLVYLERQILKLAAVALRSQVLADYLAVPRITPLLILLRKEDHCLAAFNQLLLLLFEVSHYLGGLTSLQVSVQSAT